MIDLDLIRTQPDLVKTAVTNKKSSVDIDLLLDYDRQRREFQQKIDALNQQRNLLAKSGSHEQSHDAGGAARKEQGRKLKDEIADLEQKHTFVVEQMNELWAKVPNVPFDDVPVGPDETGNVELRRWGTPRSFDFAPKEHWELGEELDLIDNDRAGEVSGARFTYLKGDLALLQFALIQFAFKTLTDTTVLKSIAERAGLSTVPAPFVPVIPPVMITPAVFARMARLEPKEERYYIPSDDLYLVGSAEHTLGPLHMDESIPEAHLPKRYVGYSTAFRREAGAAGKDTRGILRLHQFDKIEILSFTTPEAGRIEQDMIVAIQEYLMQQLGIPYRVMAICTGDMGGPDARQIDIESWMPGQKTYRETHTSDYNTDYQSRRLKTRVKRAEGKTELVHTNDATVFAIGRTLIAIMENGQQADGSIVIPEVLAQMIGKSKIEKM